MAATFEQGTNGEMKEGQDSKGIVPSFFGGVTEEEAQKYADEYVKRLEQRYLDLEVLLSSGYF